MDLEELRERSNTYLISKGIEINENLPLIESAEGVNPRSAQDVAGRVCAIAYVIGVAYDAERDELLESLEEFKLLQYVSDYEKRVLLADELTAQDKINMEWLSESAQALAWAIGLVELNHFKHCDDDLASNIPFDNDPTEFISSAKLRAIEEIQFQSDLLYRMHWYAKHCRFEGKECLVSESTILERRKAIDWIYGVESNWDDVPSDT